MKKVDKTSTIPLYLQLSQLIQEMIESEELKEGDYLIPEREICKIQDMSRMTVNKAIMKLVNEGMLSRHQGRGTFVTKKKQTTRYQNLESFSEIMKKKGINFSTDLISFEKKKLPSKLTKRLQMESDTGIAIKRIRNLEQEPVILEMIYLNPEMCPGLSQALVEKNSLYEMYHYRYHHQLLKAEQTIKPILLSKEQAKILKQPVDSLALQIDRTVYTTEEKVMEQTRSIFLSQKHDFEIVLTHS